MTHPTFIRVRTASGALSYAQVESDQALLLEGAPWVDVKPSSTRVPLSLVQVICPVEPSKVIGIGRNYKAHAAELGHDLPSEPLMFLKPPSCVQGPNQAVVLPAQSERVDFEAELGVVMGKHARNIRAAEALQCVFGYTVVCDVTARDLQKKDDQWTRAKGFDTFCPVGPAIVCGLDPSPLQVQLRQNGQLKQDGNTSDMIFTVAQLIAYVSSVMTLEPGDLIATGTPQGVGPMKPGDQIAVVIPGIGELTFPVVAA